MDQIEMIKHLLDRPRLYLPERSGKCLLAFLDGISSAHFLLKSPERLLLVEIAERLREELPDLYRVTTIRVSDAVDRMAGGDDGKSFDIIAQMINRVLEKMTR